MKKVGGRRLMILVVAIVIVLITVYTIWDNHRIKVMKQNIVINNLPEELEGFTILQVTDIHEREFGKNQHKLIDIINSLSYDVIVFTGDMLDSRSSTNYSPFYHLIEGIQKKEHALYVPGNSDPISYILHRTLPYEKHEFDEGMEKRGVRLLSSLHSIPIGSSTVHFVNFDMSTLDIDENIRVIDGIGNSRHEQYQKYLQHQRQLLEEIGPIDELEKEDVLIALNHYPVVDNRIDMIRNDPSPKIVLRDYDLIIAGHYHGGQIRLPFLGALFVPEPYYENGGLFPPQDRVKGLWEYDGIKQYVSAGLGSSDAIPFLKFRFLNTPEINLLTLTGSEE